MFFRLYMMCCKTARAQDIKSSCFVRVNIVNLFLSKSSSVCIICKRNISRYVQKPIVTFVHPLCKELLAVFI